MPRTPDFPPQEGQGENPDTRRRLLKVIERIYPRIGGDGTSGSPISHAQELFKVVSALRETNQLYAWPGSGEEDQTFGEGQELYLSFIGEDGMPVLSQEKIQLPKSPASFIAALEAYIVGKEWSEVKRILEDEPDFNEKEIAKTFQENMRTARSLKEIAHLMESLKSTVKTKSLRTQLIQLATERFERVISNEAQSAENFEELKRAQGDARAFFDNASVAGISSVGAMDAIDEAAVELAHGRFAQARTLKDVREVSQELSQFRFSFDDLYRQPLEAKAEDLRAKIGFLYDLRRAKDHSTLTALQGRIEQHSFSTDEAAAAYKEELGDLVLKKLKKHGLGK